MMLVRSFAFLKIKQISSSALAHALACVLALTLAACSSGVKLDPPPVVDRTGKNNGDLTQGNSSANNTTLVDLDANANGSNGQNKAGPSGVNKIVYFDFDSFVIKPQFQSLIESHARFIKANSSRSIMIEGHTDERGGREYNLALGQKRAEAVRRSLTLLGVSDAQIEAVSFGKEKPAALGSDESAMSQNRRAEISYR